MIGLPPIPTFDGLHPLIVHFPIALLLVAPLLIVVGLLLDPVKGRPWLSAALLLLALGTVATWVSVASGEAAGEMAERAPGVATVLEQHESLAETTRIVFTVLTLAFAAMVTAPRLLRRPLPRAPYTTVMVLFLVAYGAGAALLANTAHQGGRLVHELGVRAMVASGGLAPSPVGDPARAEETAQDND